MNTEEKLDALIRSKSWIDLTEDERAFVSVELGSEELYNNMRQVESSLAEVRAIHVGPAPGARQSLQKAFRKKHERYTWKTIFLFRTPAYASAFLVVLALGLGWTLGSSRSNVLYQTKIIKGDTVFLASKPDTVFIPKVVYKRILVKQEPVLTKLDPAQSLPSAESKGVNMKEKEELDSFIFSGTE